MSSKILGPAFSPIVPYQRGDDAALGDKLIQPAWALRGPLTRPKGLHNTENERMNLGFIVICIIIGLAIVGLIMSVAVGGE